MATLLYREVLLPFRENRAVLGENLNEPVVRHTHLAVYSFKRHCP